MGSSLSSSVQKNANTVDIVCRLVVDNEGQFAGLAPVDFVGAEAGRAAAFDFAAVLVTSVGKGFNPEYHRLKIPGVPTGAVDCGLHCNTHNAKFNGGPLTTEQVEMIEKCTDEFILTVDLRDFKVLVGLPSNDKATGVIGYIALLITPDSLPEYNRAVAIYGGKPRSGNIAHVSVCGWELPGFETTTEARAAFSLTTSDGETYPDGKPFYTANVFPAKAASGDEKQEAD